MTGTSDITDMRRRDRAEDDEWIETMLEGAGVGVLATVAEGQPFVNGNLFVYDRERRAIYLHTARLGRTRANMERDERVCFTVTQIGRLLPADTALEFSTEFASVVAFGRGSVVTDPDEQRHGLQAMLDKYFPDLKAGTDYRAITDDELDRTSVFRVDVTEWTGKKKQVEAGFPGAREFVELSMFGG